MKVFPGLAMAAVLTLTLATVSVAQAQPEQATPAQVRQLLKITGSEKMMRSMMELMNNRMSTFMRKALPCVPASYWQHYAGKDAEKDLLNRLLPVYQRHFTRKDVTGLLKFYRTPLGQKVVTEMPKTMREAVKVGQNWGRDHARQMLEKLKKDGTLNAQGKCPALPPAAKSSSK